MHGLGASSLGQCNCLTRPHVLRSPKFSSNGNVRKTSMKNGSAYQVEVRDSCSLSACSEPDWLSCTQQVPAASDGAPHGRKFYTVSSLDFFQVEAPEGIPVEEVMKRFKNESRRVNVLGEVCAQDQQRASPLQCSSNHMHGLVTAVTNVCTFRFGGEGILRTTKICSSAKRSRST